MMEITCKIQKENFIHVCFVFFFWLIFIYPLFPACQPAPNQCGKCLGSAESRGQDLPGNEHVAQTAAVPRSSQPLSPRPEKKQTHELHCYLIRQSHTGISLWFQVQTLLNLNLYTMDCWITILHVILETTYTRFLWILATTYLRFFVFRNQHS